MSSSTYNYDEDGETWPYFAITLLGAGLVPYTLVAVLRLRARKADSVVSTNLPAVLKFVLPWQSAIDRVRRRSGSNANYVHLAAAAVGWAVLFLLVLRLKQQTQQAGFDPYDILGVSTLAGEKAIKSAYRKLSLKFHPDKIAADATEAFKQEMEAVYMKITLAYKALTDEATKKNFELYGHPDGPQDKVMGIALPQWLVDSALLPLLVVAYLVIIVGVLPYTVWLWWSAAKRYTSTGLHADTATRFALHMVNLQPSEVPTPLGVLAVVSQAEEFSLMFPGISAKEVEAHVVAYLKHERADAAVEEKRLRIVLVLPHLVDGLLDIAGTFRATQFVLEAVDLRRSVIQCVFPKGRHQQLTQLPHVDAAVVAKQDVRTVGKLFRLGAAAQKQALGIESDADLEDALLVARKLPVLKEVECKVVVPGELVVTPALLAFLEIRVVVKSPSVVFKGGKVPAAIVSKARPAPTFEDEAEPLREYEAQPTVPLAHAPHFPADAAAKWTVMMAMQADGKLASYTEVEHLDLSNLELTQEELTGKECGERAVVGVFKTPLKGPTPKEPGQFQFRVMVRNLAYFGCDLDIPVVMEVQHPPPVKDDTMDHEYSSSEEEVDTEDEKDAESDFSDLDTDTDEEEEK